MEGVSSVQRSLGTSRKQVLSVVVFGAGASCIARHLFLLAPTAIVIRATAVNKSGFGTTVSM